MANCSATTKGKDGCTIPADRVRGGSWFCHVHDPEGLFQLQQEAKRQDRIARKRERQSRTWKPSRDVGPRWKGAPPIKF